MLTATMSKGLEKGFLQGGPGIVAGQSIGGLTSEIPRGEAQVLKQLAESALKKSHIISCLRTYVPSFLLVMAIPLGKIFQR